jgi:peptidoglycan/LPS O-acetylase OafA/YrhL
MLFYLVFPLLNRYINNLERSVAFVFTTLVIDMIYSALIGSLPIAEGRRATFLNYSFLHHLPTFAMGMLAYYLFDRIDRRSPSNHSLGVALIGAAVFGYAALLNGKLPSLFDRSHWLGIIYGLLLLGLVLAPLSAVVNRATSFFGTISFSLYLNHPLLVYALRPVYAYFYSLAIPVAFRYLGCAALTLLILTVGSYLTYRLIELPGMRLASRITRRRIPPPPHEMSEKWRRAA